MSLAERHAPRYDVNPRVLDNLIFVTLAVGIVGARLVYIARFPSAFAESPLSAVSLNPGLLDDWGGIAAGLLAALVYGNRKGASFWPTLDALTTALAVFAVALGLAHIASGSAFGAPTQLPWGVELWGERRHPSQIYETGAAALILWASWPRKQAERPAGMQFLGFVALSAAARLFLEAFRGDSVLLPYGIRLAQVVAWLVLAASLWGMGKRAAIKPALTQEGNIAREQGSK